jgi:hypothetical protein
MKDLLSKNNEANYILNTEKKYVESIFPQFFVDDKSPQFIRKYMQKLLDLVINNYESIPSDDKFIAKYLKQHNISTFDVPIQYKNSYDNNIDLWDLNCKYLANYVEIFDRLPDFKDSNDQ